MKTWVLGVLLIVSVALNLWAFVGRRPVDQRAAPPARVSNADGPATKIVEQGASSNTSNPVAPGVACSQAATEIADLRARLRVLEAEQKAHLPADKRFEEGVADPSSKQRLETQLQRIFNTDGGSNPWTVECRDQICKVEVVAESPQLAQAQLSLMQHDPALRPLVAGYAFFGSTPTQDVVSGKAEVEVPAYLTVRSEADANAMAALTAATEQLKASGAVRDCTHGYSEKGTLKVVLTLDPGAPLRADLEGAGLAQTAAGACVRDRLLELASAAAIPSPETEQRLWLYLESPPAAP